MKHALSFFFTSAIAIGCSGGTADNNQAPDASNPGNPDTTTDAENSVLDASPMASTTIPQWSLLDVQPQSAKAGMSYGLDAFPDKIVVALLVEGS